MSLFRGHRIKALVFSLLFFFSSRPVPLERKFLIRLLLDMASGDLRGEVKTRLVR